MKELGQKNKGINLTEYLDLKVNKRKDHHKYNLLLEPDHSAMYSRKQEDKEEKEGDKEEEKEKEKE